MKPEISITNPPIIDVFAGRTFELMGNLSIEIDFGGDGGKISIVIPKGWRTDFASTPRLLWWLIPPMGKYSRAVVFHDWAYSRHSNVSRFLADALFRELCMQLGVPFYERILMFYAVRAFGWRHWRK